MGKTKIVAIFCYPMDNSTRAKTFDSWEELTKYEEKWKKISYLVVAFKSKSGDFLIR